MEAGHQLVQVGQGAEQRVDVLVVAYVIAVVVHWRAVHGREPDDVHAQAGQVVKAADDAGKVAHAVAVGVGKAAGVDLVNGPAPAPP